MIEIHQPLPPNTFLRQQTTASTAALLIRDSPQAGCHRGQRWNGEKNNNNKKGRGWFLSNKEKQVCWCFFKFILMQP